MEFCTVFCLSSVAVAAILFVSRIIPAVLETLREKKSPRKPQPNPAVLQTAHHLEALGMPDEAKAFQERYWELVGQGDLPAASEFLVRTRQALFLREDWEGGIVDSLFPD